MGTLNEDASLKPAGSARRSARKLASSAVKKTVRQSGSGDKPSHDAFWRRPSEWTFEDEARRNPTLLIRRTLRSGQRVRYYGNVVVVGDVNPGAEVEAGGDIIVMGWLRGLAHAGAPEDDRAVVSAFRLNPTQLRIGRYIGRAPDAGEPDLLPVPEMAEVRDGQLVIDRWRDSVLSDTIR